MVDGFRYPHQATDRRTDRDEGVSERPPFCGSPFCQVFRLRQRGGRMEGIRGKYAVHGFDSVVFFDGLFLAVFSEVLTVSSRISSFPQILGLSESPQAGAACMETFPSGLSEGSRQSSGWLTLDGVLPILFLGLPLQVSIVRNCFAPLLGSPSFWTAWFAFRAPFLLQRLSGGCPGAHRVSSGLL